MQIVLSFLFCSLIWCVGEKSDIAVYRLGGVRPIDEMPAQSLSDDAFTETIGGVSFRMIPVKGGRFEMGCEAAQIICGDDEKPIHTAILSAYAIGETEVTQALWRAVMGDNPSAFKDCDECPVEMVSWEDAQQFIAKLNAMARHQYRLPTEAEWEYAARERGKDILFGNGKNIADPAEMNFLAKAEYQTDFSVGGVYREKSTPVKTFVPNALGLYDMAGNVWEWCQDWHGAYSTGAQTNPVGPNTGAKRIFRGGSWHSLPQDCLAQYRSHSLPNMRRNNVGFRLAARRGRR